MIHSLKRAYQHTQKFLGNADREGKKYANGFDMFMNAAGRTVLTLQPLLDDVAPGARKALTQGLEDYDIVRSRVMSAHSTGERCMGALGNNVLELNLRSS